MKRFIIFLILLVAFIPVKAKTILVIEPGHGGKDTGVVLDSFVEKDYTRELASFLKKEIEKNSNIKVVLVNKGGETIYNPDKVRCFTYLSDADVFISLHIGADIKNKRGIYIYVPSWKNEKISMEFAKKLKKHLENTNKVIIQEGNFRVLKHTSIPSVMIEVGYITDEKDKKLLNDYNYKKNIANAIIKALREWNNSLFYKE